MAPGGWTRRRCPGPTPGEDQGASPAGGRVGIWNSPPSEKVSGVTLRMPTSLVSESAVRAVWNGT